MARIAIGFCGEGRGHATRVIALAEELQAKHELFLFSYGEGYRFVSEFIAEGKINAVITRIAGVEYRYRNKRLDTVATYIGWWLFMVLRRETIARRIRMILEENEIDLALVDFEPCVATAASATDIPCISIDHQHFIRHFDLRFLPILLQVRAAIGSWACSWYAPNARVYIISAFFPAEWGNQRKENVRCVGPILRSELRRLKASDDGFLFCYFRREPAQHVFDALASCGRSVIVYGLGERPTWKGIKFKSISTSGFLLDLASCTAVVAAAGNQLISESLYLGKAYLALPERDNQEQVMNSYFLRRMGAGDFCWNNKLNCSKLSGFLAERQKYEECIIKTKNEPDAITLIESIIEYIL